MYEYNYNGMKLFVDDNASPSCRVFTGWWGDAEDGEAYTDEWSVDATSEDGSNWKIYWQFEQIRGQEPEEADALPFDDEHIDRIETLD